MLEALKNVFAQRRHVEEQSTAQRYEALVTEALAGKLDDPKSFDRVEKLLAECGRTLQQLEADCARRTEMAKLERIAVELDDLAVECKNLVLDRAKLQREYEAAIAEYKNQFPELEKKLAQTQARRQSAARATEELAHRFPGESSIGQLFNLKSQRGRLEEQINWKRHQMQSSDYEVRTLEGAIDDLKKDNQQAPKYLKESIASHQVHLDRHTRERDGLLADIKKMEAEIADIDGKTKKLTKAVAA